MQHDLADGTDSWLQRHADLDSQEREVVLIFVLATYYVSNEALHQSNSLSGSAICVVHRPEFHGDQIDSRTGEIVWCLGCKIVTEARDC